MPTPPPPPPFSDPYAPAAAASPRWPATPITVFRRDELQTPQYKLVPNVQAISAVSRDGPDPGSAVFRYDFTWPDARAPHTAEEAVDTLSNKEWALDAGDKILIRAERPDGTTEWLFYGTVTTFRLAIDAEREEVYMTAVGIAKELWDTPARGQLLRDASTPTTPGAGHDHETDLPLAFNPKGKPNATPAGAGADAGTGTAGGVDDRLYPAFMDPEVVRATPVLRAWTLALAARHLIFRHNPDTTVKSPSGPDLDLLLVAKTPRAGTAFDPNDPGTYDSKPITVPDAPMQGRDWPGQLYKLIRQFGFTFSFPLTTSTAGNPITTLTPYQPAAGPHKPLFIQARGAATDRSLSNTTDLDVTRDLKDAANRWIVEGGLRRFEVTVVLKPGYPAAAADAAPTALKTFDKADPSYTANHDAYRLYVLDETGEGHYAAGNSTKLTEVPNLDAVFGAANYAVRRRKPVGKLFTLDPNQKPRRAQLSISKNYTGPAVWDGTGTWQTVQGGWELLKDRLGVRINISNPNKWHVGNSRVTGHPYPVGVVKGVEEQAAGAAHFSLRLTVVVEGEKRLTAAADRRDASPVAAVVTRTIDAHERYRKDTILAGSEFNPTAAALYPRDDTEAATAEAVATRYTTEFGVLAGGARISHVTTAYQVGDRIEKVQGRETPLRTDSGLTGENPIYPVVTARQFLFFPEQWTILEFSDEGPDRAQFQRRVRGGEGRG